jgi:intracellular sulfur oxidation DsrE/DsrF family protein
MRIPQLTLCALFAAMLAGPALADKDGHDKGGNNECPVGLVNGMTLNEEFGPDSQELTLCNKVRHNVKLLIQLNQYGTDAAAYGLNNITNVIQDYEVTYGMRPGKDYEIVAIVHSGGGPLVVKDKGGVTVPGGQPRCDGTCGSTITNAHETEVQTLMNQGVKFLFCQNTTRGMQKAGKLPADATGALVTSVDADGVEHSVGYVTAGIAALADFQARGYQYVQP